MLAGRMSEDKLQILHALRCPHSGFYGLVPSQSALVPSSRGAHATVPLCANNRSSDCLPPSCPGSVPAAAAARSDKAHLAATPTVLAITPMTLIPAERTTDGAVSHAVRFSRPHRRQLLLFPTPASGTIHAFHASSAHA